MARFPQIGAATMIITKNERPKPSALQDMVIYQWVGKTRWLPHIGSPLYVIGSRDNHVIGVPMGRSQRDSKPVYVHIDDVACACDRENEYGIIDNLLQNYRNSRGRLEDEFAKMIRALAPRPVLIEPKTFPKFPNVRVRVRPRPLAA